MTSEPLELAQATIRRMSVELEVWRERYPLTAEFVEEEAASRIENREPRRLPPVVRWGVPA